MSDKMDGVEGGHITHTGSNEVKEYRGLGFGIGGPYDNETLMEHGLKEAFGPENFYSRPNVTVAEEGNNGAGGINGLGDIQHLNATKRAASPGQWSVRSTCSVNDESVKAEAVEAPGFKEYAANFGVRYGTEETMSVPYHDVLEGISPRLNAELCKQTQLELPMTFRLPLLDEHGKPQEGDESWKDPRLLIFLWNQLRKKNHELEITQKKLDRFLDREAYSDKLVDAMTHYTSSLERRVRTQELQLRVLQTPQSAQHPVMQNVYTPVPLAHDMSAMSLDHSWVAQHPPQYLRPTAVTPNTDSESSGMACNTPSSGNTDVHTDPDAMQTIKPNACDDVFGPSAAPPARGWTPAVKFDTKPLPELFSACFQNVESAVRGLAILNIVPNKGRRLTRAEFDIFKLAQDHLQSNKMAYFQLEDTQERQWLMTGVIAQEVIRQIFDHSVLGWFPSPHAAQFAAIWAKEQALRDPSHPLTGEYLHRHALSVSRTELANRIITTGGFWKWVQQFVHDKTNVITAIYAPAFPPHSINHLYEGLHKAVSEAVKIAIRMRQEPQTFEISFPVHGIGYHSNFMVHRNKELIGQTVPNERAPYVVRCGVLPLVKVRFLGNDTSDYTILHKAEVTLGDRKTNLRPGPNYYRHY